MTEDQNVSDKLKTLAEAIREIERTSGKASQLIAMVGEDKYLVGDLRRREGRYKVEMDEEYVADYRLKQRRTYTHEEFNKHFNEIVSESSGFENVRAKNPYKHLEGTYSSFEAVEKAVELTKAGGLIGIFKRRSPEGNGVYLIGSPEQGYSVRVAGMNLGSAGGQTYILIGKIIIPLLQEKEEVSVQKLNVPVDTLNSIAEEYST